MTAALVSRDAWQEWSPLLTAAGPAVAWWCMAHDGTITAADGGAAGSGAIDVAWLSNDVFRSPVRAPFSDWVRTAPTLRWVQSGAAGHDGELFESLVARGVRLTTSHATALPIAEYVLAHVLAVYGRHREFAAAAAAHEWRHLDVREVAGSTWLVIGMGRIGTEVSTRARAFGATVIGVRRTPQGDEPVDRLVTPAELPEMVGEADVIVVAAPADASTHHLVDAAFLARLRPGSVLVNVARGSLLDEEALLASLGQGRPGHAVLDVAAIEPLPVDSALWDHPSVTVTPHASGGGLGRFRRSAELFADNLGRYRSGAELRYEVGR